MILLTAILTSVAVSGAAWVLLHRRSVNKVIAERLSEVSTGAALPAENANITEALRPKNKDISFEKAQSDHIAKELFLAGLRSQNSINFFHFLIKLSVFLPLALILVYFLRGSLEVRTATIAVLIGFALFAYVHIMIRVNREKRKARILKNLPDFLDLLVVCTEAGLGFTAALERILKEVDPDEPLHREFKLMHYEFLGGLSLEESCSRLDRRCGVTDLSIILSSIIQSDQLGSSLGTTLRIQAMELRDKIRQRIRERAYRVPVKILFPVLLIFAAFFLLNLGLVGYQFDMTLGTKTLKAPNKTVGKTWHAYGTSQPGGYSPGK